jgi:hypothetical protein
VAERLLAPLALDFLWEALGAGEPPYPLEVRSHGATHDERTALRRRVREEPVPTAGSTSHISSAQRKPGSADIGNRLPAEGTVAGGLLDHAGRLDPSWTAGLGTLAQPDVSIDAVFCPSWTRTRCWRWPRPAGPAPCSRCSGRTAWRCARSRASAWSRRSSARCRARRGAPEQSISVPAGELATVPAGAARASTQETREAPATLTAMPSRPGGQIGPVPEPDPRRLGHDRPADTAALRHRIGELVTEVTNDRR